MCLRWSRWWRKWRSGRGATGESVGGRGLLQQRERAHTPGARHRGVSAGPEPGARTEHGEASVHDWTEPGAQSGTEGDAEEVAQYGGTAGVRTTQGAGRTGVWSAQAAAWDAAISHPRTSQGGSGVHPGGDRLQRDTLVCSQAQRVTRRLRSTVVAP